MKNIWQRGFIGAATACAAMALTHPAAATIFTYNQTNGDILSINTATNSGTLTGTNINASFTADFSGFTGGGDPGTQSFDLASLTGTRTIGGVQYTSQNRHDERLIFSTNGRVNLWSTWGRPRVGGDYITRIDGYTPPSLSTGGTPVPAPGVVGLFGVGIAGLWAVRRRKQAKTKAGAKAAH